MDGEAHTTPPPYPSTRIPKHLRRTIPGHPRLAPGFSDILPISRSVVRFCFSDLARCRRCRAIPAITTPPPGVIPDWRRLQRGSSQIIPDWRGFHEIGQFGVGFRGFPLYSFASSVDKILANCQLLFASCSIFKDRPPYYFPL